MASRAPQHVLQCSMQSVSPACCLNLLCSKHKANQKGR